MFLSNLLHENNRFAALHAFVKRSSSPDPFSPSYDDVQQPETHAPALRHHLIAMFGVFNNRKSLCYLNASKASTMAGLGWAGYVRDFRA